MPLFRGALVPGHGPAAVRRQSQTTFIECTETVLGRRKALRCGALVPFGRFHVISGNTAPFVEAHRDFELGRRVAVGGSNSERKRSDACRGHWFVVRRRAVDGLARNGIGIWRRQGGCYGHLSRMSARSNHSWGNDDAARRRGNRACLFGNLLRILTRGMPRSVRALHPCTHPVTRMACTSRTSAGRTASTG